MKQLPVPVSRVLALFLLSATTVSAQVSAPYMQDFESFALCSTACGSVCALPAGSGWSNATTDGMDWTTNEGGTPSGATGPVVDHTLGTGLGNYLYTESSGGCTTSSAELLSPVLQVSGNANPRVRFWYHMLGAAMGTLHVDVIEDPNGTATRTNDVVTAITDNVELWQQTPWIPLSPTAAGGEVQIVIRGLTGTSFTSDMAIDDFEFGEGIATDAAITDLNFGSAFCSGGLNPISATIVNEGVTSISNVPVTLSIDGVPQFTENFPGPLAPNSEAQYTFLGTVNTPPGNANFEASIALPGDGDPGNDAFLRAIDVKPTIATFPYVETFEGGAGDWTSSGSVDPWQLGTPAKPVINSAHSGLNAWVTDLTSNYQINTLASVEGPCFDVSGLTDPKFKAWVWWNSEFSWDGAQLQYNTDGSTWIRLGSVGDPGNWYNDGSIGGLAPTGSQQGWTGRASTGNGSDGWVQVEHDLPALGGASIVQFRIIFGSDGSVNDDGFAFDDVEITGADADLAITKTNGGDSAIPGTDTSYVITVSNAGPTPVIAATVADTFPAGGCSSVSWTCVAAGGASCTETGTGDINDSVDLPVEATATYTAICAIQASASGSLVNTATITAPGSVVDPDLNNNSATDDDALVASADLSIMLADSPDPVAAGSNLSYTATLTNDGPSDAQAVSITLPLPAGTSLVSATPSAGGICNAVSPVVCTFDGATAPFDIRSADIVATVTPSTTTALNATATADSSTADPDSGNNTADQVTTVSVSADLSITLTDSPDPVTAGSNLGYTATLTNNGPSDAQAVSITLPLPAGTSFVSATPSAGGSCNAVSPVVCTFADVTAPFGVRSADIVAAVAASTTGSLNTTAVADSSTADPDSANNTDVQMTAVSVSADLSVTKTDNRTTVLESTSTVYELSVRNLGPSAAVDAVLNDTIPAGLSDASWACIQAESTATCPVPQTGNGDLLVMVDLAPGEILRYDLMAVAIADAGEVVDNVLEVFEAAGASDPDSMNNQATDSNLVISSSIFSDGFEN